MGEERKEEQKKGCTGEKIDITERLFGKKEWDKDGNLSFQYIDVTFDKFGFGINYAAIGWGFGCLYMHFGRKGLRADADGLNIETLTVILRAAAPQMAKLIYEADPRVIMEMEREDRSNDDEGL